MNIVFLGRHDWANTSNRICRAINAYGGDHTARCITVYQHPFQYVEDIVISRDGDAGVAALVSTADWVIGSGDADYDAFWSLYNRHGGDHGRVGMRHSGTVLRDDWLACVDRDRDFDLAFVPMDLYRGRKNERPFVQPQTSCLPCSAPDGLPLKAIHTPSERRTKGTHEIMQAAAKLNPDLCSLAMAEGLPYTECRLLRSRHHVYIDGIDRRYANFGAAACEAMVDGLAVIGNTDRVRDNEYIKKPPIVHAVDRGDIVDILHTFAECPQELGRAQRAGIAWSDEHTSIAATYRYWDLCLK